MNTSLPHKGCGANSLTALAFGLFASLPAHSQMSVLDDHSLSRITGQAGLTLELDVEVNVSEIAYQDEGYIAIEDFTWGGVDRTGVAGVTGRFENWKMVIDVANGKEKLAYGFSELDHYYGKVSAPDADWAAAITNNDDAAVHGDGDLVFHNTSVNLFDGTGYDRDTDSDVALPGGTPGQPSNRFVDAMDDWRNSAPFGVRIGEVRLHDSGYLVGTKVDSGTILMSDFNAEVLTGPLDIVIKNNGDGSTSGVPDSKLLISDYFEISDLDVKFDFVGIGIEGFRFHNRRGDTTGLNVNKGADGVLGTADDVGAESFGFGHMKWSLAAAPDRHDGLQMGGAIKGDIDIDSITLGDNGRTIGSVYITDMTIESTLNIRGH